MTLATGTLIEITCLAQQSIFLNHEQKDQILKALPDMDEAGQSRMLELLQNQKQIEVEAIKKKLKEDPNWLSKITTLSHQAEHQVLDSKEAENSSQEEKIITELETELANL